MLVRARVIRSGGGGRRFAAGGPFRYVLITSPRPIAPARRDHTGANRRDVRETAFRYRLNTRRTGATDLRSDVRAGRGPTVDRP